MKELKFPEKLKFMKKKIHNENWKKMKNKVLLVWGLEIKNYQKNE